LLQSKEFSVASLPQGLRIISRSRFALITSWQLEVSYFAIEHSNHTLYHWVLFEPFDYLPTVDRLASPRHSRSEGGSHEIDPDSPAGNSRQGILHPLTSFGPITKLNLILGT
jgi:hypothetical protein